MEPMVTTASHSRVSGHRCAIMPVQEEGAKTLLRTHRASSAGQPSAFGGGNQSGAALLP